MKNMMKSINLFANYGKKFNVLYFLREFENKLYYKTLKKQINFSLKFHKFHVMFSVFCY